jgi:hypothetical protein
MVLRPHDELRVSVLAGGVLPARNSAHSVRIVTTRVAHERSATSSGTWLLVTARRHVMPKGRSKNHSRSQSSQQVSPMQLRRVAISALKPAPYNPRVDLTPGHPTFEKLRRSIENFGTVEPIVWNSRTGHVVGGHQRLSVLKHLGHTHVDVVVVDLDLPQEKTLNLALNRIVGEWDEGKLAELLKDLDCGPISRPRSHRL